MHAYIHTYMYIHTYIHTHLLRTYISNTLLNTDFEQQWLVIHRFRQKNTNIQQYNTMSY